MKLKNLLKVINMYDYILIQDWATEAVLFYSERQNIYGKERFEKIIESNVNTIKAEKDCIVISIEYL